MTKVKICGITNLDDAVLSVQFGADALGFNFYEKSPRFVSSDLASGIAKAVTSNVMKVGVFVNMEPFRIVKLIEDVGLDAVQLHGDEDVEYVEKLRRETSAKIIKAFRVSPSFRPENVKEFDIDAVLLDAFSSDEYGGTGRSFNLDIACDVCGLTPRLYLAGGLNADNVADAIAKVGPYAVDVASGVESAKGMKDASKLQAFIANAKNA